MQAVDEKVETIHLYVVREKEKRPYTALPLFCAFLCLLSIVAMTFYSAQHPYYEHERLTVPAELLPLRVFTAQVSIIPTGVKTYPATTAHGILTFTNGSVIAQVIPAGFLFSITSEVALITDRGVYVPAGNADGYGYAATTAHVSVAAVNLPTLAVNQVLGSSLYIRNLQPFTGGHPAYSVTFVTAQDKHRALMTARQAVALHLFGFHFPCEENYSSSEQQVLLTWRCQVVTYYLPSYLHVSSARLIGKNFMITVWFVAHPKRIWVK